MARLSIEALTQVRNVRVVDLDDPTVQRPKTIHFGNVVSLQLDNETAVRNTFDVPLLQKNKKADVSDAVNDSHIRIQRLAQMFASLRRKHPYDCHDLADIYSGSKASEIPLEELEIAYGPADVVSGAIYAVRYWHEAEDGPSWRHSHSCIGTDNGNLLAINGRSGPLTITTLEASLEAWNHGNPDAFLAKIG